MHVGEKYSRRSNCKNTHRAATTRQPAAHSNGRLDTCNTAQGSAPRCAKGARHSGIQQTAVYRCVTQQGWGTYLATRRNEQRPLGAKSGAGGGPQGVVDVPLVLLAGICGALVGRAASCGGGRWPSGGRRRASMPSCVAHQRSDPVGLGRGHQQVSGPLYMASGPADHAGQLGPRSRLFLVPTSW
jgi:hypothetical protein